VGEILGPSFTRGYGTGRQAKDAGKYCARLSASNFAKATMDESSGDDNGIIDYTRYPSSWEFTRFLSEQSVREAK